VLVEIVEMRIFKIVTIIMFRGIMVKMLEEGQIKKWRK
jgi:hypothetical protein